MPTYKVHLVTNIAGLMRNCNDSKLGKLFDMNGKEARKQLQALLDKGDRLLPSEGCKHFDSQEGCQCRYYDADGNRIDSTTN